MSGSVHRTGRGRRAVDALAEAKHPHGRDAIWRALLNGRPGRTWTAVEMTKSSAAPDKTVRSYMAALEAGGIVVRTTVGDRGTTAWRWADGYTPRSTEPPRLRPDGTPATAGDQLDRMWRTARMLKQFNAQDLALAASLEGAPIKLSFARQYCAVLAKGGYLRAVARVPKTATVYRVVKNTGPRAPQVQRRNALFDPNLGRVVWVDEAEGTHAAAR